VLELGLLEDALFSQAREPLQQLPFPRPSRDWIGLVLKDISFTGAVELLLVEWSGKPEQHQLCRLIYSSPKIDSNLPEVRRLERDRRFKSGVDLWGRDVDGHADPGVAAPTLYKANEVVGNEDLLRSLSEDEASRLQAEYVALFVVPEIRRFPERWINVNGGEIGRWLLEGCELAAKKEIHRNLSNPILRNGWLEAKLLFADVSE
jgi:hypothetical protein